MPSKPQISKIFASTRELGWDREQLNQVIAQVSGGDSVSELTVEEASEVIEILVKAGASSGRKPRGRRTASNEILMVTPEQRDMINDLRQQLGGNWLRDPYFAGACRKRIKKDRPTTAGEGATIIEMLKKRLDYDRRKMQ